MNIVSKITKLNVFKILLNVLLFPNFCVEYN